MTVARRKAGTEPGLSASFNLSCLVYPIRQSFVRGISFRRPSFIGLHPYIGSVFAQEKFKHIVTSPHKAHSLNFLSH
jgi:hypothetical protein